MIWRRDNALFISALLHKCKHDKGQRLKVVKSESQKIEMGDSDSGDSPGDSPGDSSSKVSDCHKDTFDDETEDLSNKRLRLLSTIPNAWRVSLCYIWDLR